jgi:excinuclease UvrABC ATPase subunit
MSIDKLVVRGAREHNLKDVSIELPRNSLVVFTGLSGSGKSSLAFDTIFAEGQRRYVESLSAYARQFLGQMDKPDVYRRQFQLIRNQPIVIRAQLSERLLRFMTTCVCSLLEPVVRIARNVAKK